MFCTSGISLFVVPGELSFSYSLSLLNIQLPVKEVFDVSFEFLKQFLIR